jgi:hypothetical protein
MMLEVWPNWCGLAGIESQSQERGKLEDPRVTRREISVRGHSIGNQVRSLIKEYGLLFPSAMGLQFRNQVCELLGEPDDGSWCRRGDRLDLPPYDRRPIALPIGIKRRRLSGSYASTQPVWRN